MVRLGISVEGPTEERFVKKVLIPHLATNDIHVTPVSIKGDVTVARAKKELEKMLYSFDHVTTLYDFYGFRGKNQGETKNSLEQQILNALPANLRRKFIPYIQMYEFEGLLFSDPEIIEQSLEGKDLFKWASSILREFNNNPEAVNNSEQTAPSKRFEKDTNYMKTTHGPNIAADIGLDKIRTMCQGFDQWLTRLESL